MKRIRLNTLFSICLLTLISLSFLTLYINSYWNYKSLKNLTIETLSENIKENAENSFNEEIKQEANAFNHQLREVLNIAKDIAAQISIINDSGLKKESTDIKLKYNKVYGYFNYLSGSSFVIHRNEPFGFIAAAKGTNKTVSNQAKLRIKQLATLKPVMKRVVLTLGNSISSIAIFSKENTVVAYCAIPSNAFNAIKIDNMLDFNNSAKKFNFNKSKILPAFECRKSSLGKNLSLILLHYPVFGKKGELDEIVTLVLRYNWMSDELKSIFMNKTYEEYKTITAIFDKNNNIAYLPENGYKLLSIPQSKKEKNAKGYGYTLSLKDSTSSEIKELEKLFANKKHGKEYLKIKGDKYLVIFNKIPIGDWTVVIFVKTEKLYKPIQQVESKFEYLSKLRHKRYIINFIIISIFGSLLFYCLLKFLIIKPIEAFREQVIKIGKGNFNFKVKVAGSKEMYELSRTFNNLGNRLDQFTSNLKKEITARQTIETELQIAGDLQQSVLPKITSEFKGRTFELYSDLIPAKEMSGDFYDFFYLNRETLVLVLADVSGKGITAAFYMSMAKVIIRETCLSNRTFTPGEVFEKVNWVLVKNDDSCMFLTGYLIYYDIITGKIKYANAGHHEFICSNLDNKIEPGGLLNNIALGIYDETKYTTSEIKLEPEESLILYTDGIIEAPNKNNEEYGLTRLVKLIENSSTRSIEGLGNLITKDALEFEKDERFDDITILILKRKA